MHARLTTNTLANQHAKPFHIRLAAIRVLQKVHAEGTSLSTALPWAMQKLQPQEQPLLQELCYGVLRWEWRLEAILATMMSKPLRNKDKDIHFVLLTGLYQLLFGNKPSYAVVDDCVQTTRTLKKAWATGLVNGTLRRLLREQEARCALANQSPVSRFSHPQWLIEAIQRDWPQDADAILSANNQRPPMSLRVNGQQFSREAYLAELMATNITAIADPISPSGLRLTSPTQVSQLPAFHTGGVSVQDTAAQLAAGLLDPQPGDRVLDACAAPGGKTMHLLEYEPDIAELVALDIDETRLKKVNENLQRLGKTDKTRLLTGDASKPDMWWDQKAFNRILLDAPCSALGVIRRHPDIKRLRQADDIPALATRQAQLLKAMWPLLAKGGYMLYATCSVMKIENEYCIEAFIRQTEDAHPVTIPATWGRASGHGRQILPGESDMDGFFYALIQKASE